MALEILEAAMMSNEYALLVLDSLASMSPSAELESGFDEWQMGLMARMFSKFCRKYESRVNAAARGAEKPPTFFLVNQIRKSMDQYNPTFTPGGGQQDNTSDTMSEVLRSSKIWEGMSTATEEKDRNYIGSWIKYSNVKNKNDPPFKRTLFGVLNENYLGHPKYTFLHADTIYRFSHKLGIVEMASGGRYEVPSMKIKAHGYPKMLAEIMQNRELRDFLIDSIKGALPTIPVQFSTDILEPTEIPDDPAALADKLTET